MRAVILFFMLLFSVGTFAATDTDLLGKPIPSFSVPDLLNPGKIFSSNQLRGHVSLLNIWASWCSACKLEVPLLMHIRQTTDIPIYSLNYQDTSEHAMAFLSSKGNPYTKIGLDEDGSVADTLGIYGLPETFIIDEQGIVRYAFRGAITQVYWDRVLLPVIQKYQTASIKID